jgi:glycosyltransferase involved in cell wall biosynthesis
MLDSLLDQAAAANFEIIIVDDGSTDDTVAIARSYVDRHPGTLKVILAGHSGPAGARNQGVAAASGEWLLFFDDDSLFASTFAAELTALLQQPPADVIGLADEPRPEDSYMAKSLRYVELASRLTVKRSRPVKGLALWRREQFLTVGGFAEERGYYQQEDIEMIERAIASRLKVRYLTRPAVYHRAPTLSDFIRKALAAMMVRNPPLPWLYFRGNLVLVILAIVAGIGLVVWRQPSLALPILGSALVAGLLLASMITVVVGAPLRFIPGVFISGLIRIPFMVLGWLIYVVRRLTGQIHPDDISRAPDRI